MDKTSQNPSVLNFSDAMPCEWFLSGQTTENGPVTEVPIHSERFTIGRQTGSILQLKSAAISSNHAEIKPNPGGESLTLCDLNSTNGTFVNGVQVRGEVALYDGDLVQFASLVFRVQTNAARKESNTVSVSGALHDRALTMMQFDRLINEGGVYPHYQPLVRLADKEVFAYEVLGRSKLFGLQTPDEMFYAASQLDLEAELSEVFRYQGIMKADGVMPSHNLFVNTHPKELGQPRLYDSLKEIRKAAPDRKITLEIHEAATTDLRMMLELRDVLDSLDMELAFDDFGVGQARLVELAEVRPEYLKFDMQLTKNLEHAPVKRQEVVRLFARMVKDLGISTLAEGVETEACHQMLLDMGFDMGQGFYYGKPMSMKTILERDGEDSSEVDEHEASENTASQDHDTETP